MDGQLNELEPHPAAAGARRWLIGYIQRNDAYALLRLQESFASCSIEGNRLAEICSETLRRLLAKEPVSDRYMLGLVWTIRDMEEKDAGGDHRLIPLPQNADEARTMALLGTNWLEQNAPEHLRSSPPASASFQNRVKPWMDACFGPIISADKAERNHRFLEEALELVQACGASRQDCLQLVDYVYGRAVGEPKQESGGVSVTHAALCLANGINMHDAAEVELARVWTKIEQIRAKQAAKPRGSVLPTSPSYETKPASVV